MHFRVERETSFAEMTLSNQFWRFTGIDDGDAMFPKHDSALYLVLDCTVVATCENEVLAMGSRHWDVIPKEEGENLLGFKMG